MQRVLLAAIVACLLIGAGWAAAQQTQFRYRTPGDPADIRTGNDIGFRIYEMNDGRAVGTLVVRTKDGEWVETRPAPGRGYVVPLDAK